MDGQIRTAAVALHEFFINLQAAGFTPKEALYIVGQQVAGSASRS